MVGSCKSGSSGPRPNTSSRISSITRSFSTRLRGVLAQPSAVWPLSRRPGGVGLPGIPRRIVMSQGGYVTLVGFVAQDPRQHETKGGRLTKLRIGATTRVQDRATQEWRDADTSYYDVSCWRKLGDHVQASLRKGDPRSEEHTSE